MSRKANKYISLAKTIAMQSNYGKFRHGAVLVKGSSVRNVSSNKDRYCGFGCRFRRNDQGNPTLHAELGVILGLDRSVTQGSTVYVARINNDGNARMSKPCSMCEAALIHCGVKKVTYTTSKGTIETFKLEKEVT